MKEKADDSDLNLSHEENGSRNIKIVNVELKESYCILEGKKHGLYEL